MQEEQQSGSRNLQEHHSTKNVVLGSLHYSKTYFQHQSSGNTEKGQLSSQVKNISYIATTGVH